MPRLFVLSFRGSLLVEGGAREGLFPHSDTLSAALVALWGAANPGADRGAVAASPPFRVSSALPWLTGPGGAPTVLLPLPLGAWPEAVRSAAEKSKQGPQAKQAKRALFADAPVVAALARGALPAQAHASDGGVLVTSFPVTEPLAAKRERLRLAVDRASGAPVEGALFTSTAWQFSKGAGLAVVVDVDDEALPSFRGALRLLGLEGIGADRSVGMGQFDIVREEPWQTPALGSGALMLLSLLHPTKADIAKGALEGRYGFVVRSGWITSSGPGTLRRGRVRMLTEGSVLPAGVGPKPGEVVEVQRACPELGLPHSIFRDGRAVTIPIADGGWHG